MTHGVNTGGGGGGAGSNLVPSGSTATTASAPGDGSIVIQFTESVLFTSSLPQSGNVNLPYSHTFTATGSPTFSVTSGTVPSGLTLAPSGVLSGTPTAVGTFAFTVTATNGTPPYRTAVRVAPDPPGVHAHRDHGAQQPGRLKTASDVICGLEGKDSLTGLGGEDVLVGGPGNDSLGGGKGSDLLDGGADPDTAWFNDSGVSGTTIVDLATGQVMNPVLGTDSIVRIGGLSTVEHVNTGPGDDTITGDAQATRLPAKRRASTRSRWW